MKRIILFSFILWSLNLIASDDSWQDQNYLKNKDEIIEQERRHYNSFQKTIKALKTREFRNLPHHRRHHYSLETGYDDLYKHIRVYGSSSGYEYSSLNIFTQIIKFFDISREQSIKAYSLNNKDQHGISISELSKVKFHALCLNGEGYLFLRYPRISNPNKYNELVSFHKNRKDCEEKRDWLMQQIESAKVNKAALTVQTNNNENQEGKYFAVTLLHRPAIHSIDVHDKMRQPGIKPTNKPKKNQLLMHPEI